MSGVAVFTDTGTGLPQGWIDEYAIRALPFQVIFGDETYRDGIDMRLEDFFARLPDADPPPTTSAPPPADWEKAYREAISQGAQGILVLPLSAKLSMSYSTASVAAQAISQVPVRVLDTRRAAMAQGYVVLAAARAARRNESLAAVVAAAEQAISASGFIFVIDTLKYLHRGGRVPAVAAMAGSLLKVNPIMALRDDGSVGIANAARGMAKALQRVVSELDKRLQGRELCEVAVMHGNVPDLAAALRALIMDRFDIDGVTTTHMTTAMGVHTGPGIVGVAYRAGEG